MESKEDLKFFIIFLLIANVIGALIYVAKSNPVGIFNCISWAVISGYIIINFNKVFAEKR